MKIILSPTKKMQEDRDSLSSPSLPCLLSRTQRILAALRSLSAQELQALWGCNDQITAQNIERLSHMDLEKGLTPAILSYEGLAFQHMAPSVFTDQELAYVQDHLRILSGFYGVLKPLDGITPYRLEMQARLSVDGSASLYDFWGRDLYREVRDDSGIILNLASKEYDKCIRKYLQPEDRFITCTFCELVKGRLQQKGTFAKMARGEMVRFLAEVRGDSPEKAREFHGLGYHFREDLSSETEYIFQRIPE